MNIKPLADRVLILPAPAEEKTIGGIIIPDKMCIRDSLYVLWHYEKHEVILCD